MAVARVRLPRAFLFMQITVDLPDDVARHADPGREALEAPHHQAALLFGVVRFEFDGFLKERQIYGRAYSIEGLERDLSDLDKLRAKESERSTTLF